MFMSQFKKSKNVFSWVAVSTTFFGMLAAADANPFHDSHTESKTNTIELPDLQTTVYTKPPGQNDNHSNSETVRQSEKFLYSFPAPSAIAANATPSSSKQMQQSDNNNTVLINFNNVNIIEFIRFVSRISNKNFVFDDTDLQFNVTIVSEEPLGVANIMTALIQELHIHDLSLIEEGNNFIIHKNGTINGVSQVVSNNFPNISKANIVTRIFLLNTLNPEKAAIILQPLASGSAIIEPLRDSNYLIVTDLASNTEKMGQLLKSIDASNSGVIVGQYQSTDTAVDELIPLAMNILESIAENQTLVLVPNRINNTIFIVSSPYLVERSISILKHLEKNKGYTGILNIDEGTSSGVRPKKSNTTNSSNTAPQIDLIRTPAGNWAQNEVNNWVFTSADQSGSTKESPPPGKWDRDYNNNWQFTKGDFSKENALMPKGKWGMNKAGVWTYELDKEEYFNQETLSRTVPEISPIPAVKPKVTKFYIHKLDYRKGDSIIPVLLDLAETIRKTSKGNNELVAALTSVRWLKIPNALAFSGTEEALDRARALTMEVDTPMRQVFLEVLMLETSLIDTLQYGVSYGTDFGGGNTSGAQGFRITPASLGSALATTGLTGLGTTAIGVPFVPDGTGLGNGDGFNLGVIGQTITHNGTQFASMGALVQALHGQTSAKIITNPKLLIEDNTAAELFVGENTPYRTQSISNDQGNVITTNYIYKDVGTRLRITPYVGNSDVVFLNIYQETTRAVPSDISVDINSSPGPTTEIHRTVTRVNIPNNYFLIISGMVRNDEQRIRNQVPCLGGIPILGAAFSAKDNSYGQRNVMIFIRPKIIDTEEEIQVITKREQDIYKYNNCQRNINEYEVSEALDLLNIDRTLHPEGYDDNYCEMKRPL